MKTNENNSLNFIGEGSHTYTMHITREIIDRPTCACTTRNPILAFPSIFLSGTRQRRFLPSAKSKTHSTRQRRILPTARFLAHGKIHLCRVPEKNTRQRLLGRVLLFWHSAKNHFAIWQKSSTR